MKIIKAKTGRTQVPLGFIFFHHEIPDDCLAVGDGQHYKKSDYPELMELIPYLANTDGDTFELFFQYNFQNISWCDECPPHLMQF